MSEPSTRSSGTRFSNTRSSVTTSEVENDKSRVKTEPHSSSPESSAPSSQFTTDATGSSYMTRRKSERLCKKLTVSDENDRKSRRRTVAGGSLSHHSESKTGDPDMAQDVDSMSTTSSGSRSSNRLKQKRALAVIKPEARRGTPPPIVDLTRSLPNDQAVTVKNWLSQATPNAKQKEEATSEASGLNQNSAQLMPISQSTNTVSKMIVSDTLTSDHKESMASASENLGQRVKIKETIITPDTPSKPLPAGNTGSESRPNSTNTGSSRRLRGGHMPNGRSRQSLDSTKYRQKSLIAYLSPRKTEVKQEGMSCQDNLYGRSVRGLRSRETTRQSASACLDHVESMDTESGTAESGKLQTSVGGKGGSGVMDVSMEVGYIPKVYNTSLGKLQGRTVKNTVQTSSSAKDCISVVSSTATGSTMSAALGEVKTKLAPGTPEKLVKGFHDAAKKWARSPIGTRRRSHVLSSVVQSAAESVGKDSTPPQRFQGNSIGQSTKLQSEPVAEDRSRTDQTLVDSSQNNLQAKSAIDAAKKRLQWSPLQGVATVASAAKDQTVDEEPVPGTSAASSVPVLGAKRRILCDTKEELRVEQDVSPKKRPKVSCFGGYMYMMY